MNDRRSIVPSTTLMSGDVASWASLHGPGIGWGGAIGGAALTTGDGAEGLAGTGACADEEAAGDAKRRTDSATKCPLLGSAANKAANVVAMTASPTNSPRTAVRSGDGVPCGSGSARRVSPGTTGSSTTSMTGIDPDLPGDGDGAAKSHPLGCSPGASAGESGRSTCCEPSPSPG